MSGLGSGWIALVVAALFVGSVLLGVWRAGQWLLQRERAWNDAVGEVMAATVQRRDREQTLGIILERSIQALGAHSGTLHWTTAQGETFELAHAVNVERLDWLAAVPADDVLIRQLGSSPVPVLLGMDRLTIRWQALAVGRDAGVVATRFGKEAVMVLAWASRRAAERHLPAFQAIQRYAEQVLAEYADLEARAAEVQALSDSLSHYERLTRTAAHDLSNKLAAAHSILDLATAGDGLEDETVDLIRQAMEQLSLSRPLVDEVSDPNRKLEMEPLQVEELAQLAAAMLSRRRRDRAVTFTMDVEPGLPPVWGERLAVLRVLDNLISNALKHNTQVSDLDVWLRVWAEGQCVLFEVSDNGIGISDEAQSQLFEFGFSTDSTGQVKGHGLGLWSSRRLVEAMGGEIWVASDLGHGTLFCFALPAVADGSATRDSPSAQSCASTYQLAA